MDKKERYTINKSLGEGGFGSVSLGYDKINNREVVIKKILKSKTEEKYFNREIKDMQEMKNCKFACEYYDHYSDNDYYYIVMEKCDGDLLNLLEEKKSGFSESMNKKILLQLNEAFKIMRIKNIIHRDLKPQNIFIKYNSINHDDFTIKLGDFGLSRQYDNKNFSTNAGTPAFMPPEQFKHNYDPSKCDLWAIGVIIYFLKFIDLPYSEFLKGNIPKKFENKLLDDLVNRLIVPDPAKRISWEGYFNHPYFK